MIRIPEFIDLDRSLRTSTTRERNLFLLAVLFSLSAYGAIAYEVQRYETTAVALILITLSASYAFMLLSGAIADLWLVLMAAMTMRLVFLFSIPSMSDDVFRFLWDGWLWHHGYDPFLLTPKQYMSAGTGEARLYALLGNRETHTVYPAVPMGLARLAVALSDDLTTRMVILRIANLTAETGTLLLLTGLVRRKKIPLLSLAAYALNPLVIIELSGNLHHEALVIFFLVASAVLLERKKDGPAGLLFAGAVASKVLPLIFLPGWLASLGRKRGSLFLIVVAGGVLAAFLAQFSGGFFNGMGAGLGLYFNRFEFNASVWYVIREAGYLFTGFNIIRYAGPVMVITGGILILVVSVGKGFAPDNRSCTDWLPRLSLFALGIYLLFSTTVHPWYLAPMVLFAVPAGFVFPLVWSCLAMFTYLGYIRTGYSEQVWLVAAEYLIVFFIFLTEWKQRAAKP